MALKISNIRVAGHTERVEIICPDCQHPNVYWTHPQKQYCMIRLCHNCGALIGFDIEEVLDG